MGLALGASLFWTVTPILLASAGRRIGPYFVNLLRLTLAAAMLAVVAAVATGWHDTNLLRIPLNSVLWFVTSGITGLVFGDLFYLKALTTIGPRRTSQLVVLSPVATVVISWTLIGEKLSFFELAGIAVILAGIAYANKPEAEHAVTAEPGRFSLKGLVFGITGSLLQGAGAVMARQAFLAAPETDPFIATFIRVAAAGMAVLFIATVRGKLTEGFRKFREPGIPLRLFLGTLSGPVLGMMLYVSAFKFALAGMVSTMSSLSPLLILPVISFRYRVTIRKEAVIGTVLAVCGVALMMAGE
jgi:drug/metabolite transporter (DMT)-like permease